ncbi:MAG: IS256 family transposase [Armatimonadetes bacterium]|nr:IS256 family transposase [Armatimonadota bacterium]
MRPGPAGAFGRGGPLSPATIQRLKAGWQGEYAAWQQRRLDGLEVVSVWAGGIYIQAGLDQDKSCVLVLGGALSDGRNVVLGLESGHRERKESWARRLRSLRDRGLACPKLVVGDGALGLWGALREVYPSATEQRCWNHRMVNVLDRLQQKDQETGKRLLRQRVYADSRQDAEKAKRTCQGWCQTQSYGQAAALLDEDWERRVAFYAFPKAHWGHLRTTNPVESPLAALRLRTEAAQRFQKVENATAVVWKLLWVAEQRFRRLNAPGLLTAVWQGAVFVDGLPAPIGKETAQEGAKTAA